MSGDSIDFSLVSELWYYILKFLPPFKRTVLSSTNKKFYSIINDPLLYVGDILDIKKAEIFTPESDLIFTPESDLIFTPKILKFLSTRCKFISEINIYDRTPNEVIHVIPQYCPNVERINFIGGLYTFIELEPLRYCHKLKYLNLEQSHILGPNDLHFFENIQVLLPVRVPIKNIFDRVIKNILEASFFKPFMPTDEIGIGFPDWELSRLFAVPFSITLHTENGKTERKTPKKFFKEKKQTVQLDLTERKTPKKFFKEKKQTSLLVPKSFKSPQRNNKNKIPNKSFWRHKTSHR